MRRGIAEWVGRTLRSQYQKYQCFMHIKNILEDISLKGNINILVPVVAQSIYLRYKVGYKHQLIRTTLRMFRKWYYQFSFDLSLMRYTDFVEPKLLNFMFPYSPTEKAAITYEMHEKYIELEMKLPVKPAPYQRKDWKWLKTKLAIPEAIHEKIKTAVNNKPHFPELRFQKLKGGLLIPVLQFSWDYLKETLNFTFFHEQRVLAVDIGQINLTTSVVCEGWVSDYTSHIL